MTRRAAVVVLGELAGDLGTEWSDPVGLRRAMCEDVYEVLAGLDLLDAGVAARTEELALARELTWPGAPLVEAPEAPDAPVVELVARGLLELGYDQAVLVAADAPDLPGLLIGKLLRGLVRADVAVCPVEQGGLVALAFGLPAPDWLLASGVDLDRADALAELRSAAPRRSAVSVGPGWHRVRSRADLARLDVGLEGWEATRLAREGR